MCPVLNEKFCITPLSFAANYWRGILITQCTARRLHRQIRGALQCISSTKSVVSVLLLCAQIWDTAGQERYRSLAPMYYRGAGAAVVVFDVGNMETFNGAKRWVAELRSKADANVVIALAGNKSDTPYCKGLSAEACTEYAQSAGILYMETSAKTGAKVKDVFNAIARALPKDQKAAVNATPLAPSSAASGSCC